MPSLLQEDLAQWRKALEAAAYPVRELDFIIPGDLAGLAHGERDPRTGACHFSENQAGGWGQRFFTPAVEKAALQPELFAILGATPTLCAAAASPCACAPRTPKPSPASAAPAYARSASTTPTRSRTSAATDHDRQTPSGVPHASNKPNAKRSAARPARLASATTRTLAAKSATGLTPIGDGHGRGKSLPHDTRDGSKNGLSRRLHAQVSEAIRRYRFSRILPDTFR
jgi:hypothetical protein